MKKIMIYFSLAILLIACKKETKAETYSFNGFGILKIGSNLIELKQLSLKSTNDEVIKFEKCYKSDSCELSNEIGVVNNIFIRTYKNKIYHIAFDSSPKTKKLEIAKIIFTDSLQVVNKLEDYYFISKDNKVSLSITFNRDSNTYFYTDLMMWRILKEKRDSIFVAKINKYKN